jgi:hypothetical protein
MSRASLLFLTASTLLAAAAVALGLWITPSPVNQRKINVDDQRVSDLRDLARAIGEYHSANGSLPAALHELPEAATLHLLDLASGAAYGYVVNGERAFQLCAEFATVSGKAERSYLPEAAGWKHPPGRHCFSFSAPARPAKGKGQD